jgi:hypothetical protein
MIPPDEGQREMDSQVPGQKAQKGQDGSVVPLLSQFGATPERSRIVRDGHVITAAGVSAGIDFGISLVMKLRGKRVAEQRVLMAEYAPEPPLNGGTLETARPEIKRSCS